MDSDSSSSPTAGGDPDFGFAFNDSNFSDRVLRIEIVADPPEAPPESEGCRTLADWAARKSKRRRGDVVKKENDMYHSFAALDINNCPEEQILDCQQPDVEDGAGDENHDEEDIPMIEDSPSGIRKRNLNSATHSKSSCWSWTCS
ncbi:UNVERIFIED_CONTAM: BTB/POZ domain-containing protein POB1 [Sesamum latifolium]|uniref:BTB/POZ domain-containing protein POB1 n=1 Tax=Sesamum latifolium TaxID=2727402 RepID=A0AAW2YGK6_9LAMI